MDEFESPVSDVSVFWDTVAIQVATDGVGGVQLCPALVMGGPQALPAASKHIYSRLAANAQLVDEGMPDLILSLISNGNQMSAKYLSQVESALSPFVSSCGLWLVSSGEHIDPLARAAMSTIRSVLPQTDDAVEVLHVVVNSQDVVGIQSESQLVDTSINTLLLTTRMETSDPIALGRFRAQACIRLSHPPPALLIGVPSEHISTGMTPATAQSPVLLQPSNDKHPLAMAIFAGATLAALEEMLVFVENGVPVIVLQDSCELCAILHSATLLYRTPQFEHARFVHWLGEQLHAIAIGAAEKCVETIVKVFSVALGDPQLIDFVESDQLGDLRGNVVDLCVEAYSGTSETRQILLLAGRLNQPSALAAIDLGDVLDDELLTSILCESIKSDSRIEFLAAVLELKPELNLNSDMLLKMLQCTDQHYFNTVVLGQCMGYSSVPDVIDDRFAHDLNLVLRDLSFGVDDLFPANCFNGDVFHRDSAACIRLLAIWCLLLHKPAMVRCLCAFSEEPMAFSLVLARIARSLSHQAHDWFFYEESLSDLAEQLSTAAVSVLNTVHKTSPRKAYQMLCQPLEGFRGQTLTQLAFQSNIRRIVSHECCQKWVHRLLYGHLQPRNTPFFFSNWMKILFSAIFVVPIKWWMSVRPSYLSQSKEERKSPTVALLDSSRQPKRTRAVSTYSVISGRSDALTTITAPMSVNFPIQLTSGGESATPQSMVFPLNIEEPDGEALKFFNKKTKIKRWTSPSLSLFYSTPIVKYWMSLVFRILHICLLAYSVLLPGCGDLSVDTVVWAWSFMWWMESLWVLNVRAQTTDLSLMPWRVFDVVITAIFLLLLLILKLFGEGLIPDVLFIPSVYPARVTSALFLLYWCYSTLFFYIPLSNIFGPLMVRVKLMVLRDFRNFLIMIGLVMASSAASIQAVLYPDRAFSPSVIWTSLSWAFLSLFTTDLSSLKESDTCRKSFLGSPKEYCTSVGEYGNPTCPAQSLPAYIVVVEYFVLLKLILWPLLFAFFAKTAKAVDDEADKIWKYQLYSLVTDFSIRPALPPPLTPLFFFCLACCRAKGKLFGLTFNAIDHPDMPHKDKARSTVRFGSVYRNPSVPHKKNDFMNSFWRKMAIEEWRTSTQKKECTPYDGLKAVQQQLRMIQLGHAYKKTIFGTTQTFPSVPYSNTSIHRLAVPSEQSSWNILLPRYFPPFYCKPVEEFPSEMARFVETASEQNVCDLRRCWRARQVQEQNTTEQTTNTPWSFSSAGFPLNPHGRRGLAGRGNHPRFGANKRNYYIVLSGNNSAELKLLLDDRRNLPNESHSENGARDEHLGRLLRLIGLSETDAQVFSMRRLDTSIADDSVRIGPTDTSPAHISVDVVQDADDTDNAWTEHDVWAVALRNRKICTSLVGYSWISTHALTTVNSTHAEMVHKALRIYDLA